jgi:hypothetical protein
VELIQSLLKLETLISGPPVVFRPSHQRSTLSRQKISRNSMTSFRNCPDPVYLHIIYDQLTDVIVHRLLLMYLTPRWSPQPIPSLDVTQIPPGG